MNPYLTNRAKYTSSMTANTTLIAKRGIVTNFDPAGWTVDILFYPLTSDNGYDSGVVQVQLSSLWVGNGWGLYCAPPLGVEAIVLFETGNQQLPIGINFVFNGDTTPLQGIQSGEMWLAHQSGSKLKLTNDGKVSINGQVEIDLTAPTIVITTTGNATVNADGNINLQAAITNVTGDLNINGTLSANNGSITMSGGNFTTTGNISTTADVKASGISLNSHLHGGVTTGTSDTGAPI